MIKAYNDDIELQFAYDPVGNRIRKIIIESGDTSVVKYTYDGADLLFEKDGSDALQICYLYGPGIDHILESVDSVGTKQHFADALGSVTRITDNTGTRYKLMVYDSYGNMRSDTGSVQADYVSYTGREAERDLGIYYYRARYYDPMTGRFMSRDPIGFSAGDVNLYRYINNSPTNLIDPIGLFGAGLNAGGEYYGHSDFYGNGLFWYNAEDVDPNTSPWNYSGGGTARHFRNITDIERDIIDAIEIGDKNCMQRLLHQGQDYFTHYAKGHRADLSIFFSFININGIPTPILIVDIPGHLEYFHAPDRDYEAWERAEAWTIHWVNLWLEANGQ
jgi:RHS repeat-associated protein